MVQTETDTTFDLTTPSAFQDYPCPEGITPAEFRSQKIELARFVKSLQSGEKHLNGTMTLSGGWSCRGEENGLLYVTRPDGKEFETRQQVAPHLRVVDIPERRGEMFAEMAIDFPPGGCAVLSTTPPAGAMMKNMPQFMTESMWPKK